MKEPALACFGYLASATKEAGRIKDQVSCGPNFLARASFVALAVLFEIDDTAPW
jgi:hypothetical protein